MQDLLSCWRNILEVISSVGEVGGKLIFDRRPPLCERFQDMICEARWHVADSFQMLSMLDILEEWAKEELLKVLEPVGEERRGGTWKGETWRRN